MAKYIRLVVTRNNGDRDEIWDVKEQPLEKSKDFATSISPELNVVDRHPFFKYELLVTEFDDSMSQSVRLDYKLLFKGTPKGCRKPRACISTDGQAMDAKEWIRSLSDPRPPSDLERAIEAAEIAMEHAEGFEDCEIETSFLETLVAAARLQTLSK